MLLTAIWFAVFALPLLIACLSPPPRPVSDRGPPASSADIARLWAEVLGEWRRDHNVVYYLIASAVFRDGLAGVFTFGAVLGVKVYGISATPTSCCSASAPASSPPSAPSSAVSSMTGSAPSPSSSAR